MRSTPTDLPTLADAKAGQSNMFASPIPAPPTPAPEAGSPEPPEAGSFTVTFKAAGMGPPLAVRMRRLLKAALRRYGLRASAPEKNRKMVSPCVTDRKTHF